MISAKEAAKKALDYFFEINELVGLTREKVERLAVDEVELSTENGEPVWKITIGYEMPVSLTRQIAEGAVAQRLYKQVEIDQRGNVKAMKIRVLTNE